jgi:hypothetical protein
MRSRSFSLGALNRRTPLILAELFTVGCLLQLACSSSSSPAAPSGDNPRTGGSGGSTSSGGNSATGGNPVGTSGATASAGSAGTTTTGGQTSATGGAGGSGGSTTSTGGASTGGASTGGANTGGANTGGGTATGGGAGTTGTTFVEDDGADCSVSTLPDAATLPTVTKLPDPFKKLDATRMSTKAEWRCRREEIKKQAEKYVYGTKPPKPESVTGTVSNTSITVTVTNAGKSTTFSAPVVLPGTGSGPYAAIVVLGGALFGAPLDGTVVRGEGIAYINYDPYAVGKEGTPRTNKQGAFYDIYGSTSSTGLLLAWAWGVSRIIDVIAQSNGSILKASAVGVTGCSRFGKGAFVTGVFDQRIALTMPIESGSAGVPIFRGIPGEGAQSLSSAFGEQPWLGDAFAAFTGSPTKLPDDTHEMVAMVAPRGLFIMDNPFIANLGPKSASVAALAGAEVFKALGAGQNITYYSDVQNGTHCSLRPEWAAPLRSNIRKFLTKTGTDPGIFKISASATGVLSDWIDWTTPTLN